MYLPPMYLSLCGQSLNCVYCTTDFWEAAMIGKVPNRVCTLYDIQILLLRTVCCSCSYSHKESVTTDQETQGGAVVKH